MGGTGLYFFGRVSRVDFLIGFFGGCCSGFCFLFPNLPNVFLVLKAVSGPFYQVLFQVISQLKGSYGFFRLSWFCRVFFGGYSL